MVCRMKWSLQAAAHNFSATKTILKLYVSILNLFSIFNLCLRKKLLISAFSGMFVVTFGLMTVLFDEWKWVVVLSDAVNNKCNCFVVFWLLQESLSLFCETCDKLTCRDCQLTDHRDHKYKFIHEIAEETKSMISGLLSEVR